MPKRQGNCSSEDGHSVVSGHDSGTDHKQVNNCRPNRAQAPLTESHSIEIVCDFFAEVRYVGKLSKAAMFTAEDISDGAELGV